MTEKVKKIRTAINGVLLLNKPLGISSTQALGRAKWLVGALKAGHTGTLDPLADGLLPLCFGHATKLAHDLLDADKTYEARVVLGQTTTTGDVEGEVIASSDTVITRAQWDVIIPQFLGDILQTPPMYSALKKNGKPLYEYARAGIEVEREARAVKILNLETVSFDYPHVVISVTCSKGTYIRTLAQDMGDALGVGAHLSGLRRTAVAHLQLSDALTLEQLEAIPELDRAATLLPLDALLQDAPAVYLPHALAARFVQGQRLALNDVQDLNQDVVEGVTLRIYWQDATWHAGQKTPLQPPVLLGLATQTRGVLSPQTVLMTVLPE